MRNRLFQNGRFGKVAAGITFCCLSILPVCAQSDPPSSAPAQVRADSLYRAGMAALENENWTQAVLSFENLQTLQSDYLDVHQQNALAWKKLKASRAAANAGLYGDRNRTILRIGFAGVALLALCGIVLAWPHARACYRLWRGDDEGAARVYEKILQRHPQRVHFYSPLADIYLLSGRKDARVIKVYKTVLQLNLGKAHRREINAIVTQNYLQTDQMDADAIPVLEEALKAVYRPLPQSLPVPQGAGRQLAARYI
jgi:hypothetical protein